MKKHFSRALALFLALVMVISVLPVMALAVDEGTSAGFISGLPENGSSGVIYNVDGFVMGFDLDGGKAPAKSVSLTADGDGIAALPNGTAVIKFITTGDDYYLTVGGKYLTVKDVGESKEQLVLTDAVETGSKWSIIPDKAGAVGCWNFKNAEYKWNGTQEVFLEQYTGYNGSNFTPYSYSSSKPTLFQMKIAATEEDEDGRVGEIMEPGGLPVDGSKVVVYNDYAKAVFGQPTGADAAAPALLPAAAVLGADDTLAYEDIADGGMIFTVHTGTDGDTAWYSFESNGKYLAMSENKEGGGNDETLLMIELPTDPDKVGYTRWTMTEIAGGYVMYNVSARYNNNKCCIEYFNETFSGWTFKASTPELFAMNFFEMEDKDGAGYVVNPNVTLKEPEPAIGIDCPVEFNISDVSEPTQVTAEYFTTDANNVNGEVKTAEVTLEVRKGTFTIPAAELEGMRFLSIRVSVTDALGKSYQATWAGDVSDEPLIMSPAPYPNTSTGEERRPEISVSYANVGENPTFQMLLDSATEDPYEVPAVADGTKLSYVPTEDLSEGWHGVEINITRQDGKTANLGWRFFVGENGENLYFGQIHAHTAEYSDGAGTLEDAYEHAHGVADMDFIIVTDHSNYFDTTSTATTSSYYDLSSLLKNAAGTTTKWEEARATARQYNELYEDFLCVYGYEMTWSGGPGHTNTFNTYGVVSRNNAALNNKTGYAGMHLYNDLMVNAEKGLDIEGAEAKITRDGREVTGVEATKFLPFDSNDDPVPVVSQFNHPGKTFGNFDNYAGFSAQRDDVLNLIEVGNGEGKVGGSSYFPSYSEYDLCLSKGWHVGPTNNQDNHKGNWGDSNTCRDVILTDTFSETGLYRALDQRRIYATEDQNLRIFYELEANGETYKLGDIAPIGEDEQPETVIAKLNIADPDSNDPIATVEIIGEAGKTLYKENVNSASWDGEISIPNTDGYYYIRVVEADGQIAVTAPVWVKEAIPVAADLETSASVAAQGEEETVVATLSNGSQSDELTLTGYVVEAEGAVLEEQTGLSETVAAGASKVLEIPFTPSATEPPAKKTYDITVTFDVIFRGKELSFTKTIQETSFPPELMTYIGLDKGHDNFYVSGDYAENDGNFLQICAERGIICQYINAGEMTAEKLAKYKAVFLTVPRAKGDALPTLWTEDELQALADYAANGGNIVNLSKSDRYDPDDIVDGTETYKYSSAVISNQVNEAIGADARFVRGIVVDNEMKANEAYRINFAGRELVHDTDFTEGIVPSSTGEYQWYNGTGITGGTALISPYPSTWVASYKENFTGSSYEPNYETDTVMAPKGSFSLVTCETLSGGGFLICGGACFISNYDLKYGTPAKDQYENYGMVCNILDYIKDGPFEGEITPIAEVHNGEEDQEFTVEGIITSNASDYDKDTAFFDCIYVQDETRGINAFPVSGYYFVGEKVRLHGGVTYYCGEIELNLNNEHNGSIKVISNDVTPLDPTPVSCAEAMSDDNIGNLMKVTGVITEIHETAGVIDKIYVDDGSGEQAMFFINAYIQKDSHKLDDAEVGMMIEGIGIGSRDVDESSGGGADGQIGDDVDPSLFIKRLRVRSREEFFVWAAELDTSALEAAIAEAEGLDRSLYTPESLAAVDEALAAAQAVMNDPDKTQREVTEAYNALRAALDALELKTEHELYAPVAALKDGDVVVIYNPGHERAVKNGNYKDWYMLAAEVSFNEDELIQDPADDLLWTVHVDEDGNYSFTNGENAITMWKSGSYAELTNNAAIEGGDVLWNLTLGNEEEQLYYFRSKTLVNGDKQGYMECYNKKNADGEYEPFMVGYWSNSPSDKDFGFRFYEYAYGPEEETPAGELAGKTIILHTNDTHGALMGFAQVAKVKADLEAEGATVILVDAGDFSQGTTYVSTNKGAAAVTVMNAAGYDYTTLGNHEFDFGYAQLMQNLETAEFQALCADVFSKETGESILPAYAIKEVNGVKIGFFGMETPETQTKVNPGLITEIDFGTNENGKFLESAQNAIAALKAEGADLIIGIVHLGVDAESEPYRSIDLYELIKDDVDFLIDGHSHTVMTEGPNGEPIQSTGTKASKTALMNVGYIQIDNATKKIEENKLIPLGDEAPVDEEVAAIAQAIMDEVDAEYGAVFAQSLVELNGDKAPGNRNMETNLGDLITDSMLWGVLKDMDAETLGVPEANVVAITNGGGIRAWIHAGDVTKNDINTVLPFGNTIAVVYVTGAELLEALEASTYCTPTSVGGFPQVSGMKLVIDTKKEFDEGELYPGSTYHKPNSIKRVSIDNVNGQPFDPEAVYAVVTNNFCAAGGDTYYAFKAASSQFDTGIPMDEMLMEYIVEELNAEIGPDYAEPQGRITILEADLVGKTIILHTNDTHGALMGFAQVAQVRNELEERGATVILVDAGDYSQGSAYVSTSSGEAAITVMNAAAYDYATLGNHEFDYGWPQLAANLEKAEFLPIVADVIDEATGKPIYDGHVIREVDGLKIGFFGMETPEAATKANPALIVGLLFPQAEEMYAIAQAEIDALHEEGADLVICLAHLGVDDESEPNRSIDLFANVTGLDFIIDGHSHTVMTEGPDGEPIQSTGTKASDTALMNVGYIQIDNETKQIEENKLIPLGADAPVDEKVAAVAQEIMDAVNAEYNVVFAHSLVELNGDRDPGNRTMETNLGDLITDSMLWAVQKTGGLTVDDDHVVAITNGGGIRAWIHEGDVTKKDVHTVLPFGNTVAVVYVSGAELLEALEASTYCTPKAVGGFPQVSGMHYTVTTYLPFRQGEQYPGSTYYAPAELRRVKIDSVGGKAFDPEAQYAVITNNFCAAGGDTYYAFQAAENQFDTGLPLDEVLMDYIVEELDAEIGLDYAEPQGRIKINEVFDDVATNELYYFDPVYWAVAHDPQITAGIGDNLFGPDYNCTREMIVTFLWKAYGAEEPGAKAAGFSDVPADAYYVKAVQWAVEKGITGGIGDGKFGVGIPCTRAEAVTFIWAAAGKPKPKTTVSPFGDVKEGDWFLTPVLWAVENGITGGTGDGNFAPYLKCTRGQIVTFLYKAMNLPKKLCFPSTSNDDIAKYGNIYTNFDGAEFFDLGYTWGDIVTVKFLDWELDLPVVPTFSYVDSGSPAVFVNKDGETGEPTGRMFMAINMGNFAEAYGLALKTTNPDKTYFWTAVEGVSFPVEIEIEMKEAGGYMSELILHDINRTNNREDYPELTDEEFANFRQITTTGMGDHLYRGSSPINPELNRNSYADAALENAKVSVIMNLANSQADAEAYPGFADTYYSQQNVIYLNLGVDFFAEEFQSGLADGLRFFAENPGVYYVHCTEGKDRAGFVAALLECLMGASSEEVVADYLKTYTNYYTVVDGVQQPLPEETLNAIAESNIIRSLCRAYGVEDLAAADLAAEAEAYLTEIGLTAEEVEALKANLAGETADKGFKVLPDGNNMLKYGHIDLDISVADFLELFELGDIVTVEVNGYTFDAPVVTNYDDVDTGEYLIRCAAGKTVTTLAINYGQIGVAAGIIELAPEGSNPKYQLVEGLEWPMYAAIELKEAGGYADELSIRKLNRTNVRSDYDDLTDAEFANFRAVATTGMGENVLYRSSSPIDPELGRNSYADAAAAEAGVKVFVNLADTEEEAAAFEGYSDSYYSTQTKLFLGLPVAFTSDEFKAGLADGYRFIADNEGPYLIHCLEGKDRTGLSIGVLECLMGATLEEIQADYLKTYENYFEVQDNEHIALTEAQVSYIKGIITKNLGIIFDAEDLADADLAAEAEAYLTEIGLTAEEVEALKAHLNGEYGGGETGETAFVKITEAPEDWTADTYILVYEVDAENGKVFNGVDAKEGGSYNTVAISDGVIAYDESLFTVTFETVDGGYAIHTANGYMGNNSSGNGVTTSSGTPLLNTLSFGEDGILLISNSRYFRFNTSSGNDRFRYFNQNTSNDKYPLPAVYVLVNAD